MRIDAHQHFWNYQAQRDAWITDEMRVLQRNFLPEELLPLLQQQALDGCVAVQADQSTTETEFLLSLADQHDFIKGVVGWIDLRADNIEDQLAQYTAYKKLKGFRHIVQSEPKGFLHDKKFQHGVMKLGEYGFTYDLLIKHHQLEEAMQFAHRLPDVSIVIDHLAKPDIKSGRKTHWELNMAAIATFPNVSCKISGMVTEADWNTWKPEDFFPYLDELMETFGPQRLLYGSDWPVCLLAASYHEQFNIIQLYLDRLSTHNREAIMGKNAVRIYDL